MSKDTSSKVVKASMNNETATSTERHNDREMYEKKESRYDVSKNIHWDCYGCESSFKAEEQFYNTNFSSVLEAQNDRYLKQRHPEKVMSMDEYHRKHMPQEMIFQIGNLDNQEAGIDVDDSWCKEAIPKVVEKLESVGCKVISWDLHNDEATPHVHLRYCPIDSKGEVNISNCLYEHGVMPPDVSKLETRKNGKPKFTRYNNPKQTLLNEVRAELEELGHEWCNQRGLILDDQNRTKRKHQTVNEYKREQLRKDVVELENRKEEQRIEIKTDFESQVGEMKSAFEEKERQLNAQLEADYSVREKELEARYKQREKELVDENARLVRSLEAKTNDAQARLDTVIKEEIGHKERRDKYQEEARQRRHEYGVAGEQLAGMNRMLETRRNRKRELDKAIKDSEKIVGNVNDVIEELERTPNVVKLFNAFLESMNRNDDMDKISEESRDHLQAVTLVSFGEPFEDFFRKIKQKWQAAKQSFQNRREKVVEQDIASQPYEDSRSFGD